MTHNTNKKYEFPKNPKHGDKFTGKLNIKYVWDKYENDWVVYTKQWEIGEMITENQLLGFYD